MKNLKCFWPLAIVMLLFVSWVSPAILLAEQPGTPKPPASDPANQDQDRRTTIILNGQAVINIKIQTISINLGTAESKEAAGEEDKNKKAIDFYDDCTDALGTVKERLLAILKAERKPSSLSMPDFGPILEELKDKIPEALCRAARDAVVKLIQQGGTKVNDYFGGRNVVTFDPESKENRNLNVNLWEVLRGTIEKELNRRDILNDLFPAPPKKQ